MKPLLDKSQHSFARRIALGTAACAIALTAAACSSGSEVASFQRENDLFRGGDPMAMIGLRPRKRERIDYNPRSPLVMPPAPELQTPKEKTELGAAWPQDPDELAAKEEEAREEYLREKASKEDRSRPKATASLSPMRTVRFTRPRMTRNRNAGASSRVSGSKARASAITPTLPNLHWRPRRDACIFTPTFPSL